MLLFDLVSVFFRFAALRLFGYACVVCSLGALLRIFNILVCLFIVSPLSVAAPYLLRFFFSRVSRGGRSLWRNMGDIWLRFVFVGMPSDVRGGSSFFFACGVVPWVPFFATYLAWFSHLRMCSGGYDM